MKLLILGGTRFLGRHLAEEALARGHEVTLFHRGNGVSAAGAETLFGDRNADLAPLKGRAWDLVIDTSAYWPGQVRAAMDALSGHVGHYTLVSSGSVYSDFSKRSIDETAPVLSLSQEQLAEYDRADADDNWMAHYGALKYHCELALQERMPANRTLIIRPGLIVGPYDGSDRFAYWVRRLIQGGEVLAPGRPERTIQLIDARDLAAWMLNMSEANRSGTYNAAGPDRPLTMQELLDTCRRTAGVDARFTWLSEEFLEAQEVGPWQELPLWIPETHSGEGPDMTGFLSLNSERAQQAGLTYRPLEATVQDTLRWIQTDPPEVQGSLTAERERQLLDLWNRQ